MFEDDHAAWPSLFLIPATEWLNPSSPLVSRDYEGKKSPPEYGVNVSKSWRKQLAPWSATRTHVEAVLDAAGRR